MTRIAELEAQGKQNSGNSSKSPSSDMGRKRKPPVDPSDRKRGGQPGHAGQFRDLAPSEEVDEVVDQDPSVCEDCGESLEQEPRLEAFVRQVTETPWYKAFVKEFRLWLKACPKCGKTSRGQGCMLKLASDRAFHLWHQFERGEITRNQLIRRTRPIQDEMRQRLAIILEEPGTTKKARGTAKDLLRQWDSLWTYLRRNGTVPTNNAAELAVRKAVLWRKVSLGADSEGGCRFVERMLTIAGTARKRGINLLDWLTRALQAKIENIPAPAFRG